MLPLTATDLFMSSIDGRVEHTPTHVVVRTPNNPGFYHGNFLLLPAVPDPARLPDWVARAKAAFPDANHVCLRWDGDETLPVEAARAHGLQPDEGLAMAATTFVEPPRADLVVRPLDPAREWGRFETLSRACDPTEELEVNGAYGAFKRRLRAGWRTYVDAGHAHWWAAFAPDGTMIGQCGMVDCPDGRARFQAVEVHPDHRRQGVCSTLIATVGRDALARGASMVLLAADPEGPAKGLYARLGFEAIGWQRSLLMPAEDMRVRDELPGDRSEAESLTVAAFGGPDEAHIVRTLRGTPGALSLVAERSGTLLGHALFTPVRVETADGVVRSAIALGPIAVKPTQQGRGVGAALVRAGLERCRSEGWSAAFVLGDPKYYGRFGWRPAATSGLRCIWPGVGDAFQAMALTPGGLRGMTGTVRYHPVFGTAGDHP